MKTDIVGFASWKNLSLTWKFQYEYGCIDSVLLSPRARCENVVPSGGKEALLKGN